MLYKKWIIFLYLVTFLAGMIFLSAKTVGNYSQVEVVTGFPYKNEAGKLMIETIVSHPVSDLPRQYRWYGRTSGDQRTSVKNAFLISTTTENGKTHQTWKFESSELDSFTSLILDKHILGLFSLSQDEISTNITMPEKPDNFAQIRKLKREEWLSTTESNNLLDEISSKNNLATSETLGYSGQNLPIKILRISPIDRDVDNRPIGIIFASIHGNEQISTEAAIKIIEHLLSGYGDNITTTELLTHYQIYIVPVVNPDGKESSTREESSGLDLNRQFKIEGIGPEVQCVIECQYVKDLVTSTNPEWVISLHDFGNFILTPNLNQQMSVDTQMYQDLGRLLASGSQKYQHATAYKQLYGTEIDWIAHNTKAQAFILEIGANRKSAYVSSQVEAELNEVISIFDVFSEYVVEKE